MSARHHASLQLLLPKFGIPVAEEPGGRLLDPVRVFDREAPLVVEIGSGMGDATAEMAAADPGRDYLAVEVHTPGVAHLLALVADAGLTNVRVACGDALDLFRFQLAPASLDAINVFFPDPWPKARHHKRRLITPDRLALLSSRLRPGGRLHCATDWADYAEAMLATLTAEPRLRNTCSGYAPDSGDRPITKFAQRGAFEGRDVFDLVFQRTDQPG